LIAPLGKNTQQNKTKTKSDFLNFRSLTRRALWVVFLGPFSVLAVCLGVYLKVLFSGNVSTAEQFKGLTIGLCVFVVLGIVGCMGFYGYVFFKIQRETKSQLLQQPHLSEFSRKFHLMCKCGLGLMIVLVGYIPTYIIMIYLGTNPIISATFEVLITLGVILFALSGMYTYRLDAPQTAGGYVGGQGYAMNSATEYDNQYDNNDKFDF
jgi:hypothetical protein